MLLHLLIVAVVSILLQGCSGVNYTVVPQQSMCNRNSSTCDTLDNYANTSDFFSSNNMAFIFKRGRHTLSSNISFHDLSGICLTRDDDEDWVTIECAEGVGFLFNETKDLVMKGLTFHKCGRSYTESIGPSSYLKTALYANSVRNLVMDGIIIEYTDGYGVFLALFGNSVISHCQFQYSIGSQEYAGGNAVLYFEDLTDSNCTNVEITNTSFLHGNSSHYLLASGLVIALKRPKVNVLMNYVNLTNNSAKLCSDTKYPPFFTGGNLAVMYYNYSQDNSVSINNSLFTGGHSYRGAGMHVRFYSCCNNRFTMMNSQFINNRAQEDGGAVYANITFGKKGFLSGINAIMKFENCTFSNNSVQTDKDAGIGITISSITESLSAQYSVELVKCKFIHNQNIPIEDGEYSSGSSALYVSQQPGTLMIKDCCFSSNNVTAIATFRSKLSFSGNVTLYNNSGYEGGGIVLCEASYMILDPNTTVTISNNHAQFTGGGIFAEARCLQIQPLCFYQINGASQENINETLKTTQVVMVNNTAKFAGSQLFGGTVDNCHIPIIKRDIFFDLFKFNSTDESYISSDPLNACFCNFEPMQRDCQTSFILPFGTYFLGQKIDIPLVIVGQYNGTVPGEVEFLPDTNDMVKVHPCSVHLPKTCSNVTITVISPNSSVQIQVKVKNEHATYKLNLLPVSFTVTFKDRPLGFHINNWDTDTSYTCITNLNREGFSCGVNGSVAFIERPEPKWLGYFVSSHNSTPSGFIVYQRCPMDFCLASENVTIQTNASYLSQDQQCANNRSGILCGQCKPGFSIAMGSLHCLDCTHHAILKTTVWSVVFLLAGLIMVILLLILNLTVTQGTLSEFLFYANTFFIYKATLRSGDVSQQTLYTQILDATINVINLNYGHRNCFYNGLDLVGRTWLQFLLVIYLWVITGGIVLLCRKSAWLANRIGSKAVPLLATILLLSCSPINLTILYSLTFASMEFPDNGTRFVMLFDGNVGYLSAKHIPLFIAGCVFAILSLGFTFTLLCVQPLLRYSHLKLFRWVNHLKPLIDAYTCPHIVKPRYRFWNGFLLLVRMGLYICFIIQTDYVLFGIILTCFLVQSVSWALGGVYSKAHLNTISSLYIFNIGILSTVTSFAYYSGNRENITSLSSSTVSISNCVSITTACAVFCGTVVCNILKQLRGSNSIRKLIAALPHTLRKKISEGTGYRLLKSYAVISDSDEEACDIIIT